MIKPTALQKELNEIGRAHAIEVRTHLGYNLLEPIDIIKVFTEMGVSCVRKVIESDISAMIFMYKSAKLIVLNSNRSLGHQNFSGAHELYHAIYDKDIEGRGCNIGFFNPDDINESKADYFAANFLIPDDGVNYQLSKRMTKKEISIEDVIYLENYFSVSHKAMLNKLIFMDKISVEEFKRFVPNIKNNATYCGYSTSLYERTNNEEFFTDYVEKANKVAKHEIITNSKYEELLYDAGLYDIVTNAFNDEEMYID
jgi:Zn-dependent peptidase ImmA (M78 family)